MANYFYTLWNGSPVEEKKTTSVPSPTAHGVPSALSESLTFGRASPTLRSPTLRSPTAHGVPRATADHRLRAKNSELVYPLVSDVEKLTKKVEGILEFEQSVLELEHKIERVIAKFKHIESKIDRLEKMLGT